MADYTPKTNWQDFEAGGTPVTADDLNRIEGGIGEALDTANAQPDKGDPGEPGASAYDIAVANGFDGSESEWLASLKGEPGTDGEPGADGAPTQQQWTELLDRVSLLENPEGD